MKLLKTIMCFEQGLNLRRKVLQTFALPLSYRSNVLWFLKRKQTEKGKRKKKEKSSPEKLISIRVHNSTLNTRHYVTRTLFEEAQLVWLILSCKTKTLSPSGESLTFPPSQKCSFSRVLSGYISSKVSIAGPYFLSTHNPQVVQLSYA